jgi:hypothetical protein
MALNLKLSFNIKCLYSILEKDLYENIHTTIIAKLSNGILLRMPKMDGRLVLSSLRGGYYTQSNRMVLHADKFQGTIGRCSIASH